MPFHIVLQYNLDDLEVFEFVGVKQYDTEEEAKTDGDDITQYDDGLSYQVEMS